MLHGSNKGKLLNMESKNRLTSKAANDRISVVLCFGVLSFSVGTTLSCTCTYTALAALVVAVSFHRPIWPRVPPREGSPLRGWPSFAFCN